MEEREAMQVSVYIKDRKMKPSLVCERRSKNTSRRYSFVLCQRYTTGRARTQHLLFWHPACLETAGKEFLEE